MPRNAELINELRLELRNEAVPEDVANMEAYMRNQFPFIGVRSVPRRTVIRATFKQFEPEKAKDVLQFAKELWQEPEREMQYAACDLLVKYNKLLGSEFVVNHARWFITKKSWWDSVDSIRAAIGPIVGRDAELKKVMRVWNADDNIWMIRSSLIHQLTMKKQTDANLLFELCANQATNSEFFVAKAVGWALRDYSYIYPNAVKKFVKQHSELTPLAKRESLKTINRLGL